MRNQFYLNSIYIIITCFSLSFEVQAQKGISSLTTTDDWVDYFDRSENVFGGTRKFLDSLLRSNPELMEPILQKLDERHKADGRVFLLKSLIGSTDGKPKQGKNWLEWGKLSMNTASIEEDTTTLVEVLYSLGDWYSANYDTGLFYLVKALDLGKTYRYSDSTMSHMMISASHLLYHTHNYLECIHMCRLALKSNRALDPPAVISAINNLGLSYQHIALYDSAVYFHKEGAEYARQHNIMIWWSISTGNIGDALYLQGKEEEAVPYWKIDAENSFKYGEPLNAMMTQAYLARYDFHRGEKETSLQKVQNDFWKSKGKSPTNQMVMSKILSDFYLELNMKDSADYYRRFNQRQEDSVNVMVARNNYHFVQLQVDYKKKELEALALRKQKENEIWKRNVLFVSLLALAIMTILLVNRQRLKSKLDQQQVKLARAEVDTAKRELHLFSQLLLEKNEQIEKLNDSSHHQHLISQDELVHQTLLTDYDWNRFKEMFEKIYPDFILKMKEAAPGITPAEVRLATLIKLRMDNKQMASMQGVSVGAIRSTKTRIRQKLTISSVVELEEIIQAI